MHCSRCEACVAAASRQEITHRHSTKGLSLEADWHKTEALQKGGHSVSLYLFHKAGDVAPVQLFQGLGLRF